MKHLILIIIFILTAFLNLVYAQNIPLRGSGKIATLTYTKAGYDKINLFDFEGKIEIEIGKSHQVIIQIDDNLANFVAFDLNEAESELTINLKGNKNGKLYLEDINSKISITMPEASVIKHRGNSHLMVNGIIGRYFRIEQQGNGNVSLWGSIDELDISKTGNGGVFAEKLICKSANINTIGNGNVKFNATESFSVKGAGNGDAIQFGKGSSKLFSNIIGNGKIIKPTF